MPPSLALAGCYLLVFLAFRADGRKNPYSSGALWLPTLWMMRCGSRSVDAWWGDADSGRLDPVVIAVLLGCGLVVLMRRHCQWGRIFAHNAAIFLFYGYMLVSTSWVETVENPAIKLLRPLGDLTMALVVATEANPRLAIMTMFRRTAILLIPISIVLIRYFPSLGRGQDKHWGADPWIGVATHKNPLGQLCIVSAMAFLWALVEAHRQGKPWWRERMALLYLGFTVYLFNGGGSPTSQSSTSILCVILAIVLFVSFGYFRQHVQLVVRGVVVGAIVLGVAAMLLEVFGTSPQAVVAEMFGKDATLSDRSYLWQDVIRIGMKNPLVGSGYGGFWVLSLYPQLSPEVDNMPGEAHNGYLETFANLGIIGVGLLALVILSSLRSAIRVVLTDYDYGRLRLALLLMVIVMNYSEATFPRGTHLWWFGFLVVAVYAGEWVYAKAGAMSSPVAMASISETEASAVSG